MSVWLAIPSKRPPEEVEPVLKQWRERGYRIALAVDDTVDHQAKRHLADAIIASMDGYRGYARSVNALTCGLMAHYPDAEWFICAGDDTLPDPNHSAEEIAASCAQHFVQTFGVMQPTGDRWGEGQGGFTNAPIDRVAGSPWIGREFARRMYGGAGPYWHEYRHMFVDEELRIVAEKMGVFWQRPDLTHLHNHWARPREGELMATSDRMPAFLAEANSAEHWRKYKAIFEARKAAGFPGHEPIP